MIKYELNCKDCLNVFDSWFSSSKEYEKLNKKKYLNCPNCNSVSIKKSLMTPTVLNSKKNSKRLENSKNKEIKEKLKEYQNFIKNNFDYVGENFTYEARSIHYNGKKKSKGIYGSASKKDLKELKEEGIDAQMIPWIDENEN